jgi:hypothetical protein
MINTELLGQVRELVEGNPGRHDQTSWLSNEFDPDRHRRWSVDAMKPYAGIAMPDEPADPDEPSCGTTGCVAGWASILAAPEGATMDWENIYLPNPDAPDGEETQAIQSYAAETLDLNSSQAGYLFSGDRTQEEVLAALEYLPDHAEADGYELARECGDEVGQYSHSW